MRQDFESKARKGGKDFGDKTNFGWRRVEKVEEENVNHFEGSKPGSAHDSSEKPWNQSNWNTELQGVPKKCTIRRKSETKLSAVGLNFTIFFT